MLNTDYWKSELTKLGTAGDKRMSYNIGMPITLSQTQLENIYRGGWLARKIVLIPPNEMTRAGIDIMPSEQITPEQIEQINDIMEQQRVWINIRRALQWSRMYQGGAVVMIVDDGGNSWDPVDINNIKSIKGVYDLNSYQIYEYKRQTDPEEPDFGEIEIYQMSATSSILSAASGENIQTRKLWHRSRLMIFDGLDLPESLRAQNKGWGDSILQSVYNTLRNYQQGQDSAATLVSDFSQAVFKLKDLHSTIAAEGEDSSVISDRLSLMNLSRSIIRAVVIDSDGEDFERKTTNVAGLEGLLKQFREDVVGASEMPHTVLFGDSPSGLGATGDSEERTYKDQIHAMQTQKIKPNLDLYFKYLSAASDYKLNGAKINYDFTSLFQLTEKERAEIYERIAKGDALYIQWGVLDPPEVRTRFEGDEFSLNISLDADGDRSFEEAEEVDE